jgi:hypothetical protein
MLIAGEEKEELSSTCMRYPVAPLALHQLKEGVPSQVRLPLPGAYRPGAGGRGSMIKLLTEDHEELPQLLDAWTRQ